MFRWAALLACLATSLCAIAQPYPVNPVLPVGSIGEMINHAKRNPGRISYATSGVGTTHHLSSEMLRPLTGIEWPHVPYRSSGQVINDLIRGEVQVAFSALANLVQFANAGKVRTIAINGDARFRVLPNIPTVAEQLSGYERPPGWVAYFGPAGLPAPIVARLNEEKVKAMSAPDVRAKLEMIGFVVSTSTPGELGDMVKRSSRLPAYSSRLPGSMRNKAKQCESLF